MNKIKEAAIAILSKTKTVDESTVDFTAEEISDLEALIKGCHGKVKKAEYSETMKVDSNGQWKIEKAIKPGKPLDYKQINLKPDYESMDAKAPTINYADMKAPKPVWEQKATPQAKMEAWSKANKAKREKVDEARKKGIKLDKGEGVLVEEEPTAEQKARMVVKNEILGYGPQGTPANAMAMSEKEPHKDDPKHEDKEKKKAKSIKDKAQEILDMH